MSKIESEIEMMNVRLALSKLSRDPSYLPTPMEVQKLEKQRRYRRWAEILLKKG